MTPRKSKPGKPEPKRIEVCDTCKGNGKLNSMQRGRPHQKICGDCKGSGYKKVY